jgi:predicted Zn finger-like uncharacterized protein
MQERLGAGPWFRLGGFRLDAFWQPCAVGKTENRGYKSQAMLISCPNCSARYLIADTVIGPSGRRVRCASCKHVWHQTAAQEDGKRDIVRAAAKPTAPPPPPPMVPPTSFYPRAGEDVAAVTSPAPPPDVSPRFQREPVRPGKFDFDRARARAAVMAQDISRTTTRTSNPRRKSTYLTLAIVPVGLILIGFIYKDTVKDLLRRNGFSGFSGATVLSGSESKVDLDMVAGLRIFYNRPTPVDRGSERILPITGTITNPTGSNVPLPRLTGRLLDAEGREVFSWSFPAPTEQLTSGQTVSFETVAENFPPNAVNLNIAFDTGAKAGPE